MINYLNVIVAIKLTCKNWLRVIISKIFGISIPFIELNNGLKFVVNGQIEKADLSMFSEIWHHEFYNPPFFEISDNDIVFDIGANKGYFAVYAANIAKNGTVYAFEPVDTLYEMIQKNIAVNNLNNVNVYQLGISENEGVSEFYVSTAHNGCHSLYNRADSDKKVTITSTNLTTFCTKNKIDKIDFMKLDCEGAEYEILLHLSPEFLSNVSKISLEYHDDILEHKHGELMDFLKKNNFAVVEKVGYIYALNKV